MKHRLLTDDEKEFLGKYQQLSNEGKSELVERMKALLYEQKKGDQQCVSTGKK